MSVRNGVQVVPLENTTSVEDVAKTHELVILGSEYVFKMDMAEVSHPDTLFYHDFKNWVSYVLFAGIIKLSLKKSKIDLKLGLSLPDFYQNHSRFKNLIRRKSLNYVSMGIRHRKTIEFLHVDLYPNIYVQGLFLHKLYGDSEFLIINFSADGFEGMVFTANGSALEQKYVVGKGYKHYKSAFSSDLEIAIENQGSAEGFSNDFESFFRFHLQKKLSYLLKENPDNRILFIRDGAVEATDFEKLINLVVSDQDYILVDDGPNVACHGLFEVYSNSFHSKMERVSVSVNQRYSTFLCNKNHGFKYNTRRSVKNKRAISSFSV